MSIPTLREIGEATLDMNAQVQALPKSEQAGRATVLRPAFQERFGPALLAHATQAIAEYGPVGAASFAQAIYEQLMVNAASGPTMAGNHLVMMLRRIAVAAKGGDGDIDRLGIVIDAELAKRKAAPKAPADVPIHSVADADALLAGLRPTGKDGG